MSIKTKRVLRDAKALWCVLAACAGCSSSSGDVMESEVGAVAGAGGGIAAGSTPGAGGAVSTLGATAAQGGIGVATGAAGQGGMGSGLAGAAGATSAGGTGISGGEIPMSTAPAVFEERFDGLKTDSGWLKACKWNKHVRVTEGCGVQGSKCLRIAHDPGNKEPPLFPLPPVEERPDYPAGSGGVCAPYYTNTATDVVQQVQELPPADEYSLNYDVLFEPGYDWARGGKLPGLSAKEWDSGCSVEGDGIATDPGPARWSVRMMWRASATNELYVYDQDRAPGACGLRSPTPITFATGRWIAVSIYVKLNTSATSHDAVARLYLDGALAREDAGLRLRATVSRASQISQIFFSTFYGGNESKRLYCLQQPADKSYCAVPDPMKDVTWVPSQVSYVDFDNLAVYPGHRVRVAPGE